MGNKIIQQTINGTPVSDGAGVKLLRILGTQQLDHLDPFLMLDEFRTDDSADYIAGFPSHPHRGFETVTYMKTGRFLHEDSVGNSGILEDGAIQWMTAGRGIIHSEMPQMTEGRLWGYQLWINLPASLKMSPPNYQDIPADRLPVYESDGLWVKILAGSYNNLQSPVTSLHPVNYFDIELKPDTRFEHEFLDHWNSFAYVYDGSVFIDEQEISSGQAVTFIPGANLESRAGQDGAGLLLLGSVPISEPVARYGPFVMNTQAELQQAFEDYQNGKLAV